ncbi:MAG: hypothetical protein ACE5EE_05225 [Fidelibacterota bacterium]
MLAAKIKSLLTLGFPIVILTCSPLLRGATEEDQLTQIQSISISQKANGTVIRIKTDGNLPKDVTAWEADNKWFYVTLVGCQIDTAIEKPFIETGIITDFQSLQLEETVQLNFQLTNKLSAYNILDNDQNEILITLRLPLGETVASSESENLLVNQQIKPHPFSYLVIVTGGGLIVKGIVESRFQDFLAGTVILVGGYLWMQSSPVEMAVVEESEQ